jgi:hypothetical protein
MQTMFDLPREYSLIKFEHAKPTGKIVPELLDLAERAQIAPEVVEQFEQTLAAQ